MQSGPISDGQLARQAQGPANPRRRWGVIYFAVLAHLFLWVVTLWVLSRMLGTGS